MCARWEIDWDADAYALGDMGAENAGVEV